MPGWLKKSFLGFLKVWANNIIGLKNKISRKSISNKSLSGKLQEINAKEKT